MKCGTCAPKPEMFPMGLEETRRHPCYSPDARHTYARMHLPVAPQCNVSCNYCNRKFDCVNESRPGVTSDVLSPLLAQRKFELVQEKLSNLSVIGIAGPGDALANWDSTKQTLELIRQSDQNIIFCLSTNGLLLPEYAGDLISLGVKHVTVTVNCVEPKIGAQIYRYVNYGGKRYTGAEGAEILAASQLAGIAQLAESGVVVKVNIVMIKDLNDRHIPAVVRKVRDTGASITNIMPLIPASGSVFAGYPQTSRRELQKMRDACQADLPQMYHCSQCRADAIGLLGEDRSAEFRTSSETRTGRGSQTAKQYKIAVTSKYGRLVDQHFGHAKVFAIYQVKGDSFQLVETRGAEKYCSGAEECEDDESRREEIVGVIKDCDAVLTMRLGYSARQRLEKSGILALEFCDSVENGLIHAAHALDNQA